MSTIVRFLFARMSMSNQVKFMHRFGIMLGTRFRSGRKVYTYMFRNVFAEVLYLGDNPAGAVESFLWLSGLEGLNRHLEKEIRSNLR